MPPWCGGWFDEARARLAAERLRVEVMSRNPSAGTEVAVGTAVVLTIGERPPTPCP